MRINNVPQWCLRYEYRGFQGQRHERTVDMPADEAHEWKVGDRGRVLYDSARLARAVW